MTAPIAAPIPESSAWPRRLWQLGTSRPVLSIADQGVVSAGNLLSVIILSRLCSRAEYGIYVLAFTITIALAIAQQSLIVEAYKVFVHRLDGEARRRYSGSTLVHYVAFAGFALLLLACMGVASQVAGGLGGVEQVLLPLGIVIAFILFKEYARQLSLAQLRPALALTLDIGVTVLQVGTLLWFASRGSLSASTAVLALGIAAGIAGAVWLVLCRKDFLPTVADVLPDFKKNWAFARWIFVYALLFTASVQSYPWMLGAMHGVEATATFGACFMVVNLMANPLVIGLGSFLGPKTAQAYASGGTDALAPVVAKASLFFLATLGLFCAALFLVGGWLLVLLSGEKYAGNGLVVFVIALGQLAWAYTVPANAALYAMEHAEVGFQALVCALGVTLTLGAGLVWISGPLGAAGGMLAGNIAACFYTRMALRRYLPGPSARSLVNA